MTTNSNNKKHMSNAQQRMQVANELANSQAAASSGITTAAGSLATTILCFDPAKQLSVHAVEFNSFNEPLKALEEQQATMTRAQVEEAIKEFSTEAGKLASGFNCIVEVQNVLATADNPHMVIAHRETRRADTENQPMQEGQDVSIFKIDNAMLAKETTQPFLAVHKSLSDWVIQEAPGLAAEFMTHNQSIGLNATEEAVHRAMVETMQDLEFSIVGPARTLQAINMTTLSLMNHVLDQNTNTPEQIKQKMTTAEWLGPMLNMEPMMMTCLQRLTSGLEAWTDSDSSSVVSLMATNMQNHLKALKAFDPKTRIFTLDFWLKVLSQDKDSVTLAQMISPENLLTKFWNAACRKAGEHFGGRQSEVGLLFEDWLRKSFDDIKAKYDTQYKEFTVIKEAPAAEGLPAEPQVQETDAKDAKSKKDEPIDLMKKELLGSNCVIPSSRDRRMVRTDSVIFKKNDPNDWLQMIMQLLSQQKKQETYPVDPEEPLKELESMKLAEPSDAEAVEVSNKDD